MAYFYFFQSDGYCKWMTKEIYENYPKYLKEPIEYNGRKVKFYVILDWVIRKNIGANIKWIEELNSNYVNSIEDLKEGCGIYVTGYDGDIKELEEAKRKNIAIIDNPCPWIRNLRNQLYEIKNKQTHQGIFLVDNNHIIIDIFKYILPDDIILTNTENFKEKINKNKNRKPIYLLCYATFREKDIKEVIDFINENHYNKLNILNGYKKTRCQWTKQGLFEEIRERISDKKLNEIWIICNSEYNQSVKSIVNEVKENNSKPVIIKNENDIPKEIDENKKIGVLLSPMPMPKDILNIKNKIKNIYNNF